MWSAGHRFWAPHVVLLGSPLVSHCVANLLLAKKLCAMGINSTFVTAESVIASLEAMEGLLGEENGRLRVVVLPNGEGYTPSEGGRYVKSEERTSGFVEDCVKRLMESSQDWAPPCCAIIDSFVAWILKITTPLMPSYIMWASGCAPLSVVLHAPTLEAQGSVPVDDSEPEKLKPVEFPCIPPLHPLEFIAAIQRRGLKFNLTMQRSRHILELASGILVNSMYELEPSVFDALNQHYQVGSPSSKLQSILSVGPLLPASVSTKDELGDIEMRKDPVLEWLDKQPLQSVLYVSFGSVATLSASQLVELGLGLEGSEQRFIWVVRPPPDVSSEMAASNSGVHQYLPPGFMDRVQERGVVVTGWAPQVPILQHPATGGFCTHCGWSSLTESISANVPMMAWPIQAEQKMNSRWLVEVAGAALKVRQGFEEFGTRDQVEDAVWLLMCKDEGQVVRKNVSRLKEVLEKGAAESGSSFRNIKAFAEKLHQWNDEACAS